MSVSRQDPQIPDGCKRPGTEVRDFLQPDDVTHEFCDVYVCVLNYGVHVVVDHPRDLTSTL